MRLTGGRLFCFFFAMLERVPSHFIHPILGEPAAAGGGRPPGFDGSVVPVGDCDGGVGRGGGGVLGPLAAGLEAVRRVAFEMPRGATSVLLGGLAPFLLRDRRVALFVVDGANRFDGYAFSGEARRWGVREDVLDRVFVSRAFTIHQLAAVTATMLPMAGGEGVGGGSEAVVAVLGLDHLFREESLRAVERARVLGGVMGDLGRFPGRALVTFEAPSVGEHWWRPMLEFGEVTYRVEWSEGEGWMVRGAGKAPALGGPAGEGLELGGGPGGMGSRRNHYQRRRW